jgi:hypothetical protein
MKTPEDEAFDDLARRQGMWGGGYQAKRKMAADKLQEPSATRPCRSCGGTGERWTGIDEAPTSICNPCDGTGQIALAQPAQEPVAWAVQGCSKMWRGEFAEIDAKAEAKRIGGTCVAYALYTTPPKREWVGLTLDEIEELFQSAAGADEETDIRFARLIESKLKEKNNGT